MTYDLSEAPNLKTAVYTAMGSASVCWDELPGGVFDQARAEEIAEALFNWMQDNQLTVEHSDGVIIHEGHTYYRDLLEVNPRAKE